MVQTGGDATCMSELCLADDIKDNRTGEITKNEQKYICRSSVESQSMYNTIHLGEKEIGIGTVAYLFGHSPPQHLADTTCNKRIHCIVYTKFPIAFDVLFLCKSILRFCFRMGVKYFGICRRSIFRKDVVWGF
jgi:hypothetical protein